MNPGLGFEDAIKTMLLKITNTCLAEVLKESQLRKHGQLYISVLKRGLVCYLEA